MKNLSRIDWTDAARHGGHTAPYIDGELLDYFKVYRWKVGPDAEPPNCAPVAKYTGTNLCLNFFGAFRFGASPYSYLHYCFVTKEWLPQDFIIEFDGKFWNQNAGILKMCTLVDDYDGNYAEMPGYPSVTVSPWVKFYMNTRQTFYSYFRRAPNDSLVEIEQVNENTLDFKYIFMRRNASLLLFLFYATGQWKRGMDVIPMNLIKNGDKPDRFAIWPGNEEWSCWASELINTIGISEYMEFDGMLETQVLVTTSGNIVGAANAKAALTERSETSYIELDPSEEININLVGAAVYDTDVWCLDVVSDCTDTNPLNVTFNQQKMGDVYSGPLQIGNSKAMRCVGEKIDGSWTNTIKYIFYHELKHLLGLSMNVSVGYRKIKIKNESAVMLKVFLVRALKEFENAAVLNPANELLFKYVIPPTEAPLGTPGTIQALQYQNTSGFDALEVWLSIYDDGTPIDGTIQYAAVPGGPWYDTANPPPDPKGLQIGTNVPDGEKINWYVRTNLPGADPTLASFISMFKFYVKMDVGT